MSIGSPSNHLILCHPLLILHSTFPSIRVFSKESVLCIRWPKYWSFSSSISPSNEYSGLISFRMDCFALIAVHGTSYSKFALRSLYLVWLGYFQRYQNYDSLENECPMTMIVLMLGMIESQRRRGWQRMRLASPGQFSSVQMLSHFRLFATPWTAGCQASLPITNS